MATDTGAADYEGGGLSRETNWWGAFVIGLAGTILVTGIAPVMVTSLGAAAIPLMVIVTISGYLLCLILAELSAMMPERTGGSPSYAYVAYKDKWPRFAKHVNGFTAWAYWLGWFPVAPLNMILASFYIVDKFGLLDQRHHADPHADRLLDDHHLDRRDPARVHPRLVRHPARCHVRNRARPPVDDPAHAHRHSSAVQAFVARLRQPVGLPPVGRDELLLALLGHGWLTIYIAFAFLLTWNVIAMEAAACYIGECRDPERDAKIAMNLEGAYGLFIYTMIPVSFVIVLGADQLSNAANVDPKTIFSNFASAIFGSSASWLDWAISIMLVVALSLSVLNAIMGSARAVYQMSIDGQFPRIFSTVNKHGVPGFSMSFNVACSIALVFTGGAVEIYTLSNVGYTASFIPVLVGYYLLRKNRPDMRRPVRMPNFMKYIALFLAASYFIIWSYGGLVEASLPNALLGGNDTKVYFFIGWAILLSYVFFYWYRVKVEDPKHETQARAPEPPPMPAGD